MKLTLWFTIAIVALIIGYDLWTLNAHGYETTISAVSYGLAQQYPIIAFALGVVAGHLYWPNRAAGKGIE